ncbi:sodium:solute symporter [candidate division KSB1 bacterium]|nr:MAG: sodium:solute symporter [candidate division KSB1 bacterium]
MSQLDWLIVFLYILIILFIGLYFSRRAGKSIEDYFLAGRKLPWWILGISATATYSDAGLAPAVTMLVFTGGLLGNGVWWISYMVWMPLVAVIWSKLWRRLGVLTTAELIEVRYSGKMAGIFRGVYAFFMCFGFAVILMGYVTGWLESALTPILGWSGFKMMIIFGVVAMFYTFLSGLFGAAYSDFPQFLIFLTGNIIFLPILIDKAGGWETIHNNIYALRGMDGGNQFFKVFLPAEGLGGLTIFAFVVQGLFFAASPAGGEGFTAQRFMAAKNEFHAQVGQFLNAFLTLVVRVFPFLVIGIVGASLYSLDSIKEPGDLWAILVSRYSVSGLTGLLVAGIIAAYMSTIDTEINWGASYLLNDIYKRFIKKDASKKHYVWVSRFLSILMLVFAILIAHYLVDEMKAWFLFINSVMVAFLLPLSWLRFFWYRLNIYGEMSAIIGSIPLGYFIWFVMDFKDKPFYQGFLLLFGAGLLIILIVTILTRPEKKETLMDFYNRCKPPGFWKVITSELKKEETIQRKKEIINDITDCLIGIVICGGSIMSVISILAQNPVIFIFSATITIMCIFLFIRRWKKKEVFSSLR